MKAVRSQAVRGGPVPDASPVAREPCCQTTRDQANLVSMARRGLRDHQSHRQQVIWGPCGASLLAVGAGESQARAHWTLPTRLTQERTNRVSLGGSNTCLHLERVFGTRWSEDRRSP